MKKSNNRIQSKNDLSFKVMQEFIVHFEALLSG